jgi:hypothetical protein
MPIVTEAILDCFVHMVVALVVAMSLDPVGWCNNLYSLEEFEEGRMKGRIEMSTVQTC